jgi:hypothetical protein
MLVGYSSAMNTQDVGLAPDFNPGYPSKGKLLGPAWQHVWTELQRDPQAWQDGRELAARAAQAVGAQPATVVALISRAAYAELLDREPRLVEVPISVKDESGHVITTRPGKRRRTFYRIAA